MNESLQNLSRQEYDSFVKSGMFWEMHPDATGNYAEDVEQYQRNPIRILVSGCVGAGKSVIIQLIKDKLESEGFDVTSLDEECDVMYRFNDRVAFVAESSKIEISPITIGDA